MQDIEPFYNWLKYYDSSQDERSPFYGKEYNYDLYQNTIYGFFIDPGWDSVESETLYLKILYADYEEGFVIIELLGEWNDTLHNDIMSLKRNCIDLLLAEGIHHFILIGENLMNFHGSDDAYYEEWSAEAEEGWIAAVSFPDFIRTEFRKYRIDQFIHMDGTLQIDAWRTLHPVRFYELVRTLIQRRLN
jgi:hypothetical protein